MKKLILLIGLLMLPSHAILSGYNSRTPINVSIIENVTAYQGYINLTYDLDMQPDFSDLNFTDENDNILPIWIEEKVNSDWIKVWFKGNFTTINGTQNYVYFNNDTVATSGSNGWQTFDEFDNFNDGSINTTTLTIADAGCTESSGYLECGQAVTDKVITTNAYGTGYSARFNASIDTVDYSIIGWTSDAVGTDPTFYLQRVVGWRVDGYNDDLLSIIDDGPNRDSNTGLGIDGEYNLYELQRISATNHTAIRYTGTSSPYVNTWSTEASSSNLKFVVWAYNAAQNLRVNWFLVRKIIEVEPVFTVGVKESLEFVTISASSNPTIVNISTNLSVNFVTENYTHLWWDIDNGNTSYYTTTTTLLHTYTTTGSVLINVTAYNQDTANNETGTLNLTINNPLSAINIEISEYLPFMFETPTDYINYTTTNGSGTFNSSWTFTLPSSTVETFTNQSNLSYTFDEGGITSVSLTVCDLVNSNCVTDSTNIKPWNVTGGINLVDSYNKTNILISQLIYEDSLTLNSDSSLNWTIKGNSLSGSSREFSFNDEFSFFSDSDYSHFNISVFNSWESYNKTSWFTVIAAKYNISDTTSWPASRNFYCFIYGEIYDESTRAEITSASNEYNIVFTTTDGYGHSKISGLNATKQDLNVTTSLNATPIIDDLFLSGYIVYSTPGYAERTYAFDNASIGFESSCTTANGQKLKLYVANSSEVSEVTITIYQGGVPLENALVQIQSYDPVFSTYVTIGSQMSDNNGQIQLNLASCATYYKIIVIYQGEILESTQPICFKSASHSINIDEGFGTIYSVYSSIGASCSYNNLTSYLSCTVSDTSGLSAISTLKVYNTLSSTAICTSSEESASTTLLCNMATVGSGDFIYQLYVTVGGTNYQMTTGGFSIGAPETWGDDGYIFVIMLVLTLGVGLGIITHPLVGVAVTTGAVIYAREANLISYEFGITSWLLTFAFLAIVGLIKK